MKLYLKFKTDYKEFIKLLILFAVFADSQYLYLYKFNSLSLRVTRLNIGLVGMICLFYFSNKNDFKIVIKKYTSVKYYLLYTAIVIAVESVYSILLYNENLYDVIWASSHFILLFLLPILIFCFEENHSESYFRMLMIIGIISTLLTLLVAIFEQFNLPHILVGVQALGYRNNHVRIGVSNLGKIACVYIFSRILEEEKRLRKNALIIVWGLMMVAFIYFQATRMASIGIILAYIFMLLFYRNNKNKKIIYSLIVFFVIAAILINSNTIFESFSVESEQGASTLARLLGIEYFKEIFYSNPIMGMGLIRPKNAELLSIWSGPYGVFYIDDLGMLGGLYETGLLGIILYIVPIMRMVYISFKLIKSKDKNAVFIVGITMFLISIQVSLALLSPQRVIGTIIVWAYAEVLHNKNNSTIDVNKEIN